MLYRIYHTGVGGGQEHGEDFLLHLTVTVTRVSHELLTLHTVLLTQHFLTTVVL